MSNVAPITTNDDDYDSVIPIGIIHVIFSYLHYQLKIIIHKERTTDEDWSNKLSTALIMKCHMDRPFTRI